MNKIYILLMQTNTLVEKSIRVFTRYKYGHVAISLDKSCNTIYSFGRRRVHTILFGGFTEEKKDGAFYSYFNKSRCKIYELEVTDEQFGNVEEIINEMKRNYKKYKYDYVGIILRYFRIPIKFKNKFVCTTFVASVLEKTNIYKFKKNIHFVRPKDIEEIDNLKEVYNGLYKDYNSEE